MLRGLVASALAFGCQPSGAKQNDRARVIGYLGSPDDPLVDAFVAGLRELGYEDGRNVLVLRPLPGEDQDLNLRVSYYLARPVDVLVAGNSQSAFAAKRATARTPVVMALVSDAVEVGLVDDLARPGGNLTGMSLQTATLSVKRLELLLEAFPKLHRVAVLWLLDPSRPADIRAAEMTLSAAQRSGVETIRVVISPYDGPGAVDAAAGADGLVIVSPWSAGQFRRSLIQWASARNTPAIYPTADFVLDGGLMSYGADFAAAFKRAASYVARIFDGAAPGDLPIEQPTKFDFVVSRSAAERVGLSPAVLTRADHIAP